MILFGRIKNTNNEWGFNDDKNMFDTWKEVTEEIQRETVLQANAQQKLIKGDKDGNPILVDLPQPTEEERKRKRISELERCLSETDWYAIRFADTGEEMPADIKQKRQDARNEISELRKGL